MRKITVEGIEINFNDLTEEKQKEIYEKNKKKYKQDASKSKYYSIRLAVVENETDSSELLNIMMRAEIEGDMDNIYLVGSIFKNKIFKIEEETIKILATSDVEVYRKKAAELSKDSKLLNQMLRNEVNGEQDDEVEEAIFDNEAFEIEEETIKILETSDFYGYRQKAAELSKDVGRLLIMFERELNNGTFEVLEAIVKNDLFEKETLLKYIRNNYYY